MSLDWVPVGSTPCLPWVVVGCVSFGNYGLFSQSDRHIASLCPQVRKYRPRVTLFWLALECALSALMAACLAVLFVYALHVAPAGTVQPWYDVYDSVGYAPARYWLLKRSTAGLDGGALPLPGTAGRWALPEDASGLRAVAEMYQQMDRMTYYWVLYGMLQVRARRMRACSCAVEGSWVSLPCE